jgi:regulator of protease activity HflC (stomatin/prohibitin superfamily)
MKTTTLTLMIPVVLGAAGCSYMTVQSGETGLLWTPNGMSKTVYPPGEHSIGIYDKATIYSTRSQEREEKLEVLAANGLRIELDASIRYHIRPDEVLELDQELGLQYYSILIGPTLRSQARRVVGRYQPEEIYSSQREAIEREIREGVEKIVKGRHIELEAVLIRNVALPEVIQQAINNKLEAEQQSLKMKFVIEKTKQESEQRLIEARAQAEREAIQAQAAADAKRISGKATDDYEHLIRQNLTPETLKWEEIQALSNLASSANSKVIFLGTGKEGTPLLDIK